jgi:hypothetical protein
VDSLLLYLLLDIVVVVTVIFLMFRRMAFWHPLTVYLFFHLYSFTYRAFKLTTGDASPLYTGVPNTEVITAAELSRALLWADVGLVVFAVASWLAHGQFEAKAMRPTVRRVMSPNIAKFLGVLCLPVGFYVFTALKSGNLELEVGAAGTGYLQTVALWPIGIVGLLVFTFGFRWYLLLLGGFFLGGVALQGYHRFMLVLPLLFFTAYYLQTRRLRWPTWPILLGALVFALVFPRLKYIGQAVRAGDNQEAWAQVTESFTFRSREKGESGGEDFLDQYAGALSLADTNGRNFNGSTYLAIVTLPIPRAWWPNKPGLADHLQEISTSGRNYAVEGRIITYLAEAYLNFGYVGLFLIPAFMGYVLTAFCLWANAGPQLRLSRYVYLVVFMALIQTFRDGLLSIFVFTVVHNMPMLFALILHYVPGFAAKSLDRPAADPLAGEEEEEIAAEEARRLGGPEGQWRR